MKIRTKLLALLTLCCVLIAPVETLGYGWGVERGRANEGDVARLLADQLALMRAQKRIDESIARPLAIERQRQLLGLSEGSGLAGELLDGVYEWWLKDVMGPAEAIAGNPAGSCAEAEVAIQSLLGMTRQRGLLGMSPDDNDKSASAEKTRAMDATLREMVDSARTRLAIRCREEALDECVVTGRFIQIIETDLALSRAEALFPKINGSDSIDTWVDDSLRQCAIYELHFVSNTKISQIFNLETVRDGKITLKFEARTGGILSAMKGGEKLRDLLKGETHGGSNPLFVSVKCSQPPLQVTCSPGANGDPVETRVNAMALQHREFYVDQNGISKERIVGENQFSFEFARGIYSLEALLKIPNGGTVPLPFNALGFAFYIAHKRDRLTAGLGKETAVKVERNTRGVYPVIFDFTYADQNTDGASASDSTVFELIHKPKPDPLPARDPEPSRKPLKPRNRIGG